VFGYHGREAAGGAVLVAPGRHMEVRALNDARKTRTEGRLGILHVTYQGDTSGQTTVILELARGQAAAGHDVLVGCRAESLLAGRARDAGLAVASLAFDAGAGTADAIGRILAERDIDVLNAHSSLDRRAAIAARGRNVRAALVFTRHQRTLTFPLEMWWQSRQIERYIAVSPSVARGIIGRGAQPAKVRTVPNGLPPGFLATVPADAIAAARAVLERLPGAPIVGVVARRKEQEMVLRAARHIRRPLNIAFVGIPSEPALAMLAESLPVHAVTFVPFVTDPRPYYACLGVSLLPSRLEGLSITQLETLALGIPFVGSRAAGIPDLVTDGVEGLLVEHDDDVAWAGAIERVLDDRALAASLCEAGRRKVLESYTFERTLAGTEAVYHEAVAERARRH
jgi:glycosyltransferase involved in cell wall biosynthesis